MHIDFEVSWVNCGVTECKKVKIAPGGAYHAPLGGAIFLDVFSMTLALSCDVHETGCDHASFGAL